MFMILKETLRNIVKAQREDLASYEYGTEREMLGEIELDIPFAIVISGIRRCGKSTLLRQVMKKTGKPHYVLRFEDPRAEKFGLGDFEKLDEVFREEYGDGGYYFFDEIQNVQGWEIFIRKMLDKKKRFLITGSNASLLSKELGTRLTGRHLNMELYPFSFKEFLAFSGKKAGIDSFEEYFRKGGFPEYLTFGRVDILQELFEDIIERDIVVRHGLKSAKVIKELALYLMTNVGKEFSYHNLKKIFGLGSVNSAIEYVSYMEDSYLLFTVQKFDYSLKKQLVNPKKVYSVDNGLSAANSVSFSADRGRMLENLVFLSLRRQGAGVNYFRERGECDFVTVERKAVTSAIQVCYQLTEDNREREINGLIEALEKFGMKEGLVLTYDQKDEIKAAGKKISLQPVWEWLLD
jgi:predicted AAA+ superfamily ATPase